MLKVSVLIPIWNVEKYIERCLRSVFEQTIADQAEFILVNDCSPDNSMKIAETVIGDYPHLKNQIKVINHETNRGSAAARDTLLKNAAGTYFIFVDSDDWMEPDYLEELLNAAERENADVAGCNLIKEFGNRSEPVKVPLPPDGKECVGRLLTGEIPGWLPVKLMKKEIIDSNPDTRWWVEGLDLTEDLLFSVQFFYYAHKIVYIDQELYHYRQDNNSSLSIQNNLSEEKCNQLIGIAAKTEEFLKEKDIFSEYASELNERKIFTKIWILIKNSSPQDYFSLYPGLYKSIKIKNLQTLYRKTLLFLCDCRLYGLVNLILNVKNAVNRLRR